MLRLFTDIQKIYEVVNIATTQKPLLAAKKVIQVNVNIGARANYKNC